MDQLKEFMRQAIKYRFWIAVGIAALLPIIAKFLGTGAMAEAEKTQTTKIKAAKSDAANYASKPIENEQWTSQVKEKTGLVAKDVARSHEKLYAEQYPLLTWPEIVSATIEKWGGDKYPENIDAQKVNDEIQNYIEVYDAYVDEVYKSFKPFNLETGEGIVAAPSKQALLRPVVFREDKLPSLSDVWAAQRKLWIERTLFDVIAKVNAKAKAKNWDAAPIKQIVMMEVANEYALDQKTAAKPDELQVALPLVGDPKAPPPEAKSDTTAAAPPRASSAAAAGMGGGETAGSSAPEVVQFVKSPNPEQYYIVPIALTVYMEQDRIPDLLVEFRNSPMSIRVLDFQMKKPTAPIKKPKKGEDGAAFAGLMRGEGMGGGLAGGDGAGSPGTIGPNLSQMNKGTTDYLARMKGARGGMGSSGMDKSTKKEGSTDVAKANIEKRTKKGKKGSETEKGTTKSDEDEPSALSDPYFNVVQVTIRGQARFYKAPVKAETPEAPQSPGVTDAPKDAANADAPKTDAAPKADAPKADAPKSDAPKGDAPKTDAPKADAKADAPKGDAPKADAPKGDAPKTDAPKADAPKADAPKADAPKTDAPKADAPKADAPKTDAPKTDAPKGDGDKPKR